MGQLARGLAVASLLLGSVLILSRPAAADVAPPVLPGGSYHTVPPARALDTRIGLGAPTGASRSLSLDLAGTHGVPAAGVSAVVVDLTVTGSGRSGYLVAFAHGTARPPTSNLNFAKGATVAAMAIINSGDLELYASTYTHMIVDVLGWFGTAADAASGAQFVPLSATRLLDTRTTRTPLGAHGVRSLTIAGTHGVPVDATAVVVNTTVTGPTSGGFLADYPARTTRPNTSTVNYRAGQTVANRAIVPIGTGGAIDIYNSAGTSQVLTDLSGYFEPGATGGSYYVPNATAARVSDSRYWGPPTPLQETTTTFPNQIAGNRCHEVGPTSSCGDGPVVVPYMTSEVKPVAVVLNLTVVASRTAGYATVYTGAARPATSDLNFPPSGVASSLALTGLGDDGVVTVYRTGTSYLRPSVIEDVFGYFAVPPTGPPASGVWRIDRSGAPSWRINSLTGVTDIVSGSLYSYALDGAGQVWRWPDGETQETIEATATPEHVPGLTGRFVQIADDQFGEFGYVVGLRDDSTVWEWGAILSGKDWSYHDPVQVSGLSGVTKIGSGVDVGYAITADGSLWTWGDDSTGQLGDGTTSTTYDATPRKVEGLPPIADAGGPYWTSWAVDTQGQLWQWGTDLFGIGSSPSTTPALVGPACVNGRLYHRTAFVVCPDGSVRAPDASTHALITPTALPPVAELDTDDILRLDGVVVARSNPATVESPGSVSTISTGASSDFFAVP